MMHDMEDMSMEDMAMGKMPKMKPMTMAEKKSKISEGMESLEEFAGHVAKCKAYPESVKAGVKAHVKKIRKVLAEEYIK